MKLHNRQIKSEFWNDKRIVRIGVIEKLLFIGAWQLAEDSGCIEDDPEQFQILLFPGEQNITSENIMTVRDILIEAGLLVRYSVEEREYIYIPGFHKHQVLRSPAPPVIPLPPWITWVSNDEKYQRGNYKINQNHESLKAVKKAYNSVEIRRDSYPFFSIPILLGSGSEEGGVGGGTKPPGNSGSPIDEAWKRVARLYMKTFPSKFNGTIANLVIRLRDSFEGEYKAGDIEGQIMNLAGNKDILVDDMKPELLFAPPLTAEAEESARYTRKMHEDCEESARYMREMYKTGEYAEAKN